MSEYNYRAKNDASKVVTGLVTAKNLNEAHIKLKEIKLVPINIKPKPESLFQRRKLNNKELIMFTRQMSGILGTGISIIETLRLLENQMSPSASKILKQVADSINEGSSFSAALSKFPDSFDKVYVNMIEVAESGGILTDVLEKMATLLEETEENKQKIKAALRYPKIVFTIMTIAFLIVVTLIVPKFSNVFDSFSATLPLPTRILIGINNLISSYWHLSTVFSIAFFVLFNKWKKGRGKYTYDSLCLKLPVFGSLTTKSEIARFSRFFSSLHHSGVPVTSALVLSANVLENSVITRAVYSMKESVIRGDSLAAALQSEKQFPTLATQLISIGEKSGSITQMFDQIANYYEKEVDYTIKNLTSLIEPLMIVGLGVMVLTIALGVFLPMWNMMRVFRGKV